MNELIKLTPTEQFLANTNMTITLKEIADRYKKRHRSLKSTFNIAVSKLSEDNYGSVRVAPIIIPIKSGMGKVEEISSIAMDIKTMLWFMTKFDENMRMDVINYAFEKLEKEKALAVDEAVKIASKPRVYKDGRMSVRGCIAETFNDIEEDISESDIWDALVFNGVAETKAKVTIKRVVPESLEGLIGSSKESMATYRPEVVRASYDKWVEAGKPVKSEYERLQEEFTQVSKYYEDKIKNEKMK